MLSQRLMLIPISCTEDMALAMLDIMDMLDTHTPMDTMERDLLMLSQRLMLIPISCTEVMALAMLDIMDMLDTHTPMDTTERDRLMLRLPTSMADTTDMPDLMPMDTEATDTHTGDKSYNHCKNSTKQKLKANNILL